MQTLHRRKRAWKLSEQLFRTLWSDNLYKLNTASPAAETRGVVESLVKWSLNECNNEKVYKFVKPFLTTWKSPLDLSGRTPAIERSYGEITCYCAYLLCLMTLVKDRNSEECGTDEEYR